MAGKKPKSTAVKKLEGNPGKRKLNERGVETPGQYYRRKHPGTKKFAGASEKVCWTHTMEKDMNTQYRDI